jgi:hypothetical protein
MTVDLTESQWEALEMIAGERPVGAGLSVRDLDTLEAERLVTYKNHKRQATPKGLRALAKKA